MVIGGVYIEARIFKIEGSVYIMPVRICCKDINIDETDIEKRLISSLSELPRQFNFSDYPHLLSLLESTKGLKTLAVHKTWKQILDRCVDFGEYAPRVEYLFSLFLTSSSPAKAIQLYQRSPFEIVFPPTFHLYLVSCDLTDENLNFCLSKIFIPEWSPACYCFIKRWPATLTNEQLSRFSKLELLILNEKCPSKIEYNISESRTWEDYCYLMKNKLIEADLSLFEAIKDFDEPHFNNYFKNFLKSNQNQIKTILPDLLAGSWWDYKPYLECMKLFKPLDDVTVLLSCYDGIFDQLSLCTDWSSPKITAALPCLLKQLMNIFYRPPSNLLKTIASILYQTPHALRIDWFMLEITHSPSSLEKMNLSLQNLLVGLDEATSYIKCNRFIHLSCILPNILGLLRVMNISSINETVNNLAKLALNITAFDISRPADFFDSIEDFDMEFTSELYELLRYEESSQIMYDSDEFKLEINPYADTCKVATPPSFLKIDNHTVKLFYLRSAWNLICELSWNSMNKDYYFWLFKAALLTTRHNSSALQLLRNTSIEQYLSNDIITATLKEIEMQILASYPVRRRSGPIVYLYALLYSRVSQTHSVESLLSSLDSEADNTRIHSANIFTELVKKNILKLNSPDILVLKAMELCNGSDWLIQNAGQQLLSAILKLYWRIPRAYPQSYDASFVSSIFSNTSIVSRLFTLQILDCSIIEELDSKLDEYLTSSYNCESIYIRKLTAEVCKKHNIRPKVSSINGCHTLIMQEYLETN